MNLARALKLKNRLGQKIRELEEEVQKENSKRVGSIIKIKVDESMAELQKTINNLIKLKLAIFEASREMRENILRLSENKSKIVFLKSIDTTEGKISSYEGETEYEITYDKIYVKENIAKCEAEIDILQEELDRFNHSTEVEVDIDM